MMGRYGTITLSSLYLQHQYFMERARESSRLATRIEALKKAATTRRMIAKDSSLRNWVLRSAA